MLQFSLAINPLIESVTSYIRTLIGHTVNAQMTYDDDGIFKRGPTLLVKLFFKTLTALLSAICSIVLS
jgi:hypothetical protein